MNRIWPHATKSHPCPICQKPDWCCFGDRAIKCMRVASDQICPSGGWYHFYDQTEYRPPTFTLVKREEKKLVDADKMMADFRSDTKDFMFEVLANNLGVTTESLRIMGAAWADKFKAWAFPMRDGLGKIIGIRLRNKEGFKWAVSGSRQGIFCPDENNQFDESNTHQVATLPPRIAERPIKMAFLPEGPTDAAAGISLGLYTIGRPTNQGGADQVRSFLKRLRINRVVIVADNDGVKRLGNRFGRPGIEGAMRFKKELGVLSVIWMPPSPIKDLREFIRSGGTKELIESDVAKKVWAIK